MRIAAFDDVVSLISAVAWPLTVVAIFLILRPFLPSLMKGIASRVSRVSLASVSVEFAATEVRSEIWSSLSYLRDPMSTQQWADSGQQLMFLIRAGERADSATIDLGTGDRWLTSRLYIFSAILSELLALECLVFVETRDGIPRRFVGLSHPDSVRGALGRREPWLDHAFAAARLNLTAAEVAPTFEELKTALQKRNEPLSTLYVSQLDEQLRALAGAARPVPLDAQTAEAVANRYRSSPVVSREVDTSAPEGKGWLRLGPSPLDPTHVREEHASWITDGAELDRMLRGALTRPALVETPGMTLRELQRQMVLREGTYVALVDGDGRLERVFNRRQLAETLGRQIAEQQTA